VPDDEHQILRTLAEYGQWLDDGRFGQWSELFTEDARLDVAAESTRGREAIRSYMETVQADGRRGMHVNTNAVVDVASDGTATAASDYLFVRPSDSGPVVVAAGRYRDELVVDGDRWRFRRRTISILSVRSGVADG
jgi:3-phenylpropionate/cinnamic acid dioxygenase small subunit